MKRFNGTTAMTSSSMSAPSAGMCERARFASHLFIRGAVYAASIIYAVICRLSLLVRLYGLIPDKRITVQGMDIAAA